MTGSKDSVRKKRSDEEMPDLNRILRETMDDLGRTRKHIAFRHRLRQIIPKVELDKVQLTHFLQNLFGSAAEAMPDGGTITVETTVDGREEARNFIPQPDADIYVCLRLRCVKGNPAAARAASEPVFICPVLTAGGGRISVVPDKGEGMSVIVHLPVSADEVSRFISAHSGRNAESGGSETILIVDDEGAVIEMIREILNALGYRVLTASTGEEALSTYRQQEGRIDLVLLDFMMPGMNGNEVFRQLKSIDPRARVILMSGYNVEKDLQEHLSPGFDAFLKKPFKVYELTKILRSVLQKSA